MEQQSSSSPSREDELDLLELACRLWKRKKSLLTSCWFGLAAGLVIAFSIPKEYEVTVTLSPESGKSDKGGLADAAAMFGIGGLSDGSEVDALNITLFPDILSSNPFALELYSMPVPQENDGTPVEVPLHEYMAGQRESWWSWLAGLPGRLIGATLSLFADEDGEASSLDPFRLTREETDRLESIKKSMSASVDKKTGVTTITVSLQDPVVAATVADSVVCKLQSYITSYRTKKAIEDCAYWEKLYNERQREYYAAQQRYASYIDENKSLYTQRSKVEGDRLQNDMSLAYQVYNQMAQQLQLSRGKIQEAKPVFAVVNPATVPVRASSPKKFLILAGCLLLSVCGTAGWILFGEEAWRKLKTVKD